ASLRDVAKYVRYAVDNREEVAEMAAQQAAEKAAERAAEDAEDAANAVSVPPVEDTTVVAEAEAILVEADAAETPAAPVPADITDQQAVAEASGAHVPPRDAAERPTFASWAVITGESAGGIFDTLPILD